MVATRIVNFEDTSMKDIMKCLPWTVVMESIIYTLAMCRVGDLQASEWDGLLAFDNSKVAAVTPLYYFLGEICQVLVSPGSHKLGLQCWSSQAEEGRWFSPTHSTPDSHLPHLVGFRLWCILSLPHSATGLWVCRTTCLSS